MQVRESAARGAGEVEFLRRDVSGGCTATAVAGAWIRVERVDLKFAAP